MGLKAGWMRTLDLLPFGKKMQKTQQEREGGRESCSSEKERERERQTDRERERVRQRARARKRAIERYRVCVRERACVCVCERARAYEAVERERERRPCSCCRQKESCRRRSALYGRWGGAGAPPLPTCRNILNHRFEVVTN